MIGRTVLEARPSAFGADPEDVARAIARQAHDLGFDEVALVPDGAHDAAVDGVGDVGELLAATGAKVVPEDEGTPWDHVWTARTLSYFGRDPVHRRWHHDDLVSLAPSADSVLALSHKDATPSLEARMGGDPAWRHAHLRMLLGWQWTWPGRKLLYVDGLVGGPPPAPLAHLVGELDRLVHERPALRGDDLEWVVATDSLQSVFAWLRGELLVTMNATPIARQNYVVGVPKGGAWTEILNTDAAAFGGGAGGNLGAVEAAPLPSHGRPWSLTLNLPPLSVVVLAPA